MKKVFVVLKSLAWGVVPWSLFSLSSFASSEDTELKRHEAVVTTLDNAYHLVGFSVKAKHPRRNRLRFDVHLHVGDDCVYYLEPNKPKRVRTFADLRVGDRVLLSGYSSVSSLIATEVLIQPRAK